MSLAWTLALCVFALSPGRAGGRARPVGSAEGPPPWHRLGPREPGRPHGGLGGDSAGLPALPAMALATGATLGQPAFQHRRRCLVLTDGTDDEWNEK